ncbi:unnamed protein product [Larinioides sclopetarius]|uniref:Elongation of very long chain fatty acids protein n=1 Tax=Larinioides sclopetarius TaxID=280406 RepID=A0AAV2BP35_9ARAC
MALGSHDDFFSNLYFESKLLIENLYIYPSIVICYVLFSTLIGPYLMKNRKAFILRKILIAYNFFQVFINACLTFLIVYLLVENKSFICVPRDNPWFQQIIEQNMSLCLSIFFIKTLELLDTVFFVLRKKQNQVTFLHILHHTGVCFLSWWFLRNYFIFGGFYMALAIAINSAIHSIMYLYYGLSAIGPSMAKYLWWKKYITILQIAQFVFVLAFIIISVLMGCQQLGELEIIYSIFLILILILFMNFYKKYKQA